jgi:hypothetical protein
MRLLFALGLVAALTNADIERAQTIARGPDEARARFHHQYLFDAGDPMVTEIELVTGFRRAVLVTEARLKMGDWLFARSTRAAEEALRPTRGLMSIIARLRFHPLNAYITPPPLELALGGPAPEAPLAPIETSLTPQYATPVKDGKRGNTPLVGAELEASLLQDGVGGGLRSIGVIVEGREEARVLVDLDRLD